MPPKTIHQLAGAYVQDALDLRTAIASQLVKAFRVDRVGAFELMVEHPDRVFLVYPDDAKGIIAVANGRQKAVWTIKIDPTTIAMRLRMATDKESPFKALMLYPVRPFGGHRERNTHSTDPNGRWPREFHEAFRPLYETLLRDGRVQIPQVEVGVSQERLSAYLESYPCVLRCQAVVFDEEGHRYIRLRYPLDVTIDEALAEKVIPPAHKAGCERLTARKIYKEKVQSVYEKLVRYGECDMTEGRADLRYMRAQLYRYPALSDNTIALVVDKQNGRVFYKLKTPLMVGVEEALQQEPDEGKPRRGRKRSSARIDAETRVVFEQLVREGRYDVTDRKDNYFVLMRFLRAYPCIREIRLKTEVQEINGKKRRFLLLAEPLKVTLADALKQRRERLS